MGREGAGGSGGAGCGDDRLGVEVPGDARGGSGAGAGSGAGEAGSGRGPWAIRVTTARTPRRAASYTTRSSPLARPATTTPVAIALSGQ